MGRHRLKSYRSRILESINSEPTSSLGCILPLRQSLWLDETLRQDSVLCSIDWVDDHWYPRLLCTVLGGSLYVWHATEDAQFLHLSWKRFDLWALREQLYQHADELILAGSWWVWYSKLPRSSKHDALFPALPAGHDFHADHHAEHAHRHHVGHLRQGYSASWHPRS